MEALARCPPTVGRPVFSSYFSRFGQCEAPHDPLPRIETDHRPPPSPAEQQSPPALSDTRQPRSLRSSGSTPNRRSRSPRTFCNSGGREDLVAPKLLHDQRWDRGLYPLLRIDYRASEPLDRNQPASRSCRCRRLNLSCCNASSRRRRARQSGWVLISETVNLAAALSIFGRIHCACGRLAQATSRTPWRSEMPQRRRCRAVWPT